MSKMKKIHIILAAAAALLAFSCVKEEPKELISVKLVKEIAMTYGDDVAAKVYIDENGSAVYPMKVGETITVKYSVNPAPADITSNDIRWKSSNEAVATVSQEGVVKGISAGDAGISVQQYPFSATAVASILVKVFDTATPATGIAISVPAERETEDDGTPIVYEGEEVRLSATVTPEEATYKTVTWSVNKPENATIDKITGVITGVKHGIVTVTATGVVDTDVKATLKMSVAESIDPQGVKLTAPAGPLSVSDGTYKIAFSTYPEVSTKSRIVWASSDEDVATVEKGIVTIKKYGEVEITATCPEGQGGGGLEASSTVKLVIPAGYYHEHLENDALWITKTNGATKELLTNEAGEKYLKIVPNLANAQTGRGDFGHAGLTYISRQYPIITFRMDDVNDRMDENDKGKISRNINLDTSGNAEDGTKFSGNVGGNNNKWKQKIQLSDGSVVLVYDLSTQNFNNGGLFPENTAGTFGTWQIKYADIRNSDKADIKDINFFAYRFFWFHTFTSMEEMNAWMADWSTSTGITYPGGPGYQEPTVPAGIKLDKDADIASITDGSYQIAFSKSPESGENAPVVSWVSSNEEIATVTDEGTVTVKDFGEVTFTATCAGDVEAPAGYVRNATFKLTIPKGFYQEHMTNAELWVKGQNNTVITQKTSDKNETYLEVVPQNNNNNGRGDVKHTGTTCLSREFPIITFRVDDLNDFADETGTEGKTFKRNITVDTSGKGDNDIEYKGGLGGDNNKWAKKIKCSDGSSILVYDLASQNFAKTAGDDKKIPEGVTASFTTWQIKYADIKNSDNSNIQDISHLTYRYFWFHTFRSEEEMNAYLASWSTKTGITYE